MTHLLSILVLLLKIHATKSCAGAGTIRGEEGEHTGQALGRRRTLFPPLPRKTVDGWQHPRDLGVRLPPRPAPISRPSLPRGPHPWPNSGLPGRPWPSAEPPPRCFPPPPSFPPGVSLKTQELYALVFITRYLDLFYSFISL